MSFVAASQAVDDDAATTTAEASVDWSMMPTWSYRQYLRDFIHLAQTSLKDVGAGGNDELVRSLILQIKNIWNPDELDVSDEIVLPDSYSMMAMAGWLDQNRRREIRAPSLSWLNDGSVKATWLREGGGRATCAFLPDGMVSWVLYLPEDQGAGKLKTRYLSEKLLGSSTIGLVYGEA